MAKFSCKIGYAIPVETAPGVWTDQTIEKNYRGDVILNQQRWQQAEKLNDDLNLDNSVSIIADSFAYANFGYIAYIIWMGRKWRIQSLAVSRPRIVLQIGGLYHGG